MLNVLELFQTLLSLFQSDNSQFQNEINFQFHDIHLDSVMVELHTPFS